MNREEYVNQTLKLIHCEEEKKKEIAAQLSSDIESALEQGETWEQIQNRQGTPEELAREFNENLGGNQEGPLGSRQSRKKRGMIWGIVIGILVILSISSILVWCLLRKPEVAEYGTDKAEVLQEEEPEIETRPEEEELMSDAEASERAKEIRSYFDDGDFEALVEASDESMRQQLPLSAWREVKQQNLAECGAFLKYANIAVTRTEIEGKKVIVVSMGAEYENTRVIYTITFNEKKQLCGFYLNPLH